MNVSVSDSEKNLKPVSGGMSVIYFLTEKELLTSIDDMTFSLRGKFWVVFIRRDWAGASLSQGTRAERRQCESTALVLQRADECIAWVSWTSRRGIF